MKDLSTEITFELFGSPSLKHSGCLIQIPRQKIIALLAYLALTQKPHLRSSLATLLWPESDRAHALAYLRRSLVFIKSILGDNVLAVNRGFVEWQANSLIWVDALDFQQKLTQANSHNHTNSIYCEQCVHWLKTAVSLHHASFMSDFILPDNAVFNEWQTQQAEIMQQKLAQALNSLITINEISNNLDMALHYAQQLANQDPLQEETQQQLMLLYAKSGQGGKAIQQYQRFVSKLKQELDISPLPQTTTLYEQIQIAQKQKIQPFFTTAKNISSLTYPQPSSCPVSLTPFVGRKTELDGIMQYLQDPACRLLTIVGLYGTGKTRLAIKAATAPCLSFANDIHFLSLSNVDSADTLLVAIAHALSFPFYENMTPRIHQICNELNRRPSLFILDGFNITRHAPLVDVLKRILKDTSLVKFLITSPIPLYLEEEWVLPVYSLSFPTHIEIADNLCDLDLDAFSAPQLLLQNCRRFRANLSLSPQDKRYIIQICQFVGGLPLGIEMVAPWIQVLSFKEIAEEIGLNPNFLEGAKQKDDDALQSLQAICKYSWSLLTDTEQQAICRLSLFHDRFSKETAMQVTGVTLSTLLSLTAKAFLQHILVNDSLPYTYPNSYYRMPEIIRRYAYNKLCARPHENNWISKRYCHYYTTFAQEQGMKLTNGHQQEGLALFSIELNNIKHAWKWAIHHHKLTEINNMLEPLYLFYDMKSLFKEGVAEFDQAISSFSVTEKPKNPIEQTILLGRLLARQGNLLWRLSRVEEAQEQLQKSLSLVQSCANDMNQDMALIFKGLGSIALSRKDSASAQHCFQESLYFFKKVNNQRGEAEILTHLGSVASQRGNIDKAARFDQESLEIYQSLNDPWGISVSLNNMSHSAEKSGDFSLAEELLAKSLAVARQMGSPWLIATALSNLGFIAQKQAQFAKAETYYQESLDIRTCHYLPGIPDMYQGLLEVSTHL